MLKKKLCTTILEKTDRFNEKQIELCIYCLNHILSQFVFYIFCITLGILTDNFIVSILFLAVLIPLRSYCGGAHASTRRTCFLLSYGISSLTIAIAPRMINYVPTQAILGLFVIAMLPMFILAPIIPKNKSISNNRIIMLRKKGMTSNCIICAVFICSYFTGNKTYYSSITICVIICSISVLIGYFQKKRDQYEV